MKEKKTIYGILRVSNRITEDYGIVHMYSCVSSNKDTLRKYAQRIAKSYERDSKVYIVEKEKGEKEVKKYQRWLKEVEQKRIDRFNKKTDELLIKKTYLEGLTK